MRFLGGLIFGTILVLIASLYFDPSTVESRSEIETESTLHAQTSKQHQDTALSSIEPALPVPAPVSTLAPQINTEPQPAQEQPVPEALDSENSTNIAETETTAGQPQLPGATATAALEPVPEEPAEVPAAMAPTTVSVWQPFHSEVSANGFAKRLSLQLGYPFSVIKAGPAEYHVVFQYTEESERELLSAQLATLTGAAPQ